MLYISELSRVVLDAANIPTAAPLFPSEAEQTIEIGHESVQSKEFSPKTRFILLHATEPCCLAFGPDPIARSDQARMAAGERIFGVHAGQKLAVIASEE